MSAAGVAALHEPWPAGDLEPVGSCPVCGSRRRRPLYDGLTDRNFRCAPGVWTLHRCQDCRSAFLDPRPTPASTGLAYTSYFTHVAPRVRADAERGRLSRLWRRSASAHLNRRGGYRFHPVWRPGGFLVSLARPLRAEAEARVRNLAGPPDGRILDVGCGDGSFVVEMLDAGWRAEGIDPDRAAVRVAREAGLPVRLGTASSEELPVGPFDAITLSHVIEHVHDPGAALAACASRLRPGGTIWVATPNLDALGHRLYRRDWFHLDPPRHMCVFTRDSLLDLMRSAGLVEVASALPPAASGRAVAASAALRRRGDPLHPVVGRGARLLGVAAELASVVRPRLCEELVMSGRAPAVR